MPHPLTPCSTPLSDWDQARESGELDARNNAALVDNSSAQVRSRVGCSGGTLNECVAAVHACNALSSTSQTDTFDPFDAQALSAADIEALKAQGAAGADIVAALTANSATFAAKTEFAQQKYK